MTEPRVDDEALAALVLLFNPQFNITNVQNVTMSIFNKTKTLSQRTIEACFAYQESRTPCDFVHLGQ